MSAGELVRAVGRGFSGEVNTKRGNSYIAVFHALVAAFATWKGVECLMLYAAWACGLRMQPPALRGDR